MLYKDINPNDAIFERKQTLSSSKSTRNDKDKEAYQQNIYKQTLFEHAEKLVHEKSIGNKKKQIIKLKSNLDTKKTYQERNTFIEVMIEKLMKDLQNK